MKIKELIKKLELLDKEDEVSFLLENDVLNRFTSFSNLEFQHLNLQEKKIQIVLKK